MTGFIGFVFSVFINFVLGIFIFVFLLVLSEKADEENRKGAK